MKPADTEATGRELAELLNRIDDAEEAIRKATKEAKERVGGLRDRARELTAVLEEARELKERKHVHTTVYRTRKPKKPKTGQAIDDENRKRLALAKAVGIGHYEARDPDCPDEPPMMRCTECDEPRPDASKPCPVCADTKGAGDGA